MLGRAMNIGAGLARFAARENATVPSALCSEVAAVCKPTSSDFVNVFVYGTLMRDRPNHHVMDKDRCFFQKRGITVDDFKLVKGDYDVPYMMKLEGKSDSKQVMGEMYKVREDMLTDLDVFEGTRHGRYKRVKILVNNEDGGVTPCYSYLRTTHDVDLVKRPSLSFYSKPLNYVPRHMRPDAWKTEHLRAKS